MFEKLDKCPLCKHTEFSNYMICKDHMLTQESFAISRCTNCNFLFTNPRPVKDALPKYYESPEYISHSNKASNLTNIAYKFVRNFTLKSKVKLINELSQDKTILDFGCGTGDFLKACKKNGWEINGFEPNTNAANEASNLLKIEILNQKKQLKDISKVSVITLWHVLEHLPNINKTIIKLKNCLKPKGKLIIAVPNASSLDAQIYREFWAAYDVPRHLYHFTQNTMGKFLKNHNLKLKKIVPMKLDSYYVSQLSEKYKNGETKYINSIINGYKSNNYAKKNNNNYSSLIYIAEI